MNDTFLAGCYIFVTRLGFRVLNNCLLNLMFLYLPSLTNLSFTYHQLSNANQHQSRNVRNTLISHCRNRILYSVFMW